MRRHFLSPAREFNFFCELSLDSNPTSSCIGWICSNVPKRATFFFLLQEFHHCFSDMPITRFSAVLVLFFTGTCVYVCTIKQINRGSDLIVEQNNIQNFI